MRKGLFFLLAALLVVVLPLSSALAAGTEVYRVVDRPVTELYFASEPSYLCMQYFPDVPNLASVFADQLTPGETICLDYGNSTYSETVRVKTNKDLSKDLGWNMTGHGTVRITRGTGGPNVSMMAVASFMKMFVTNAPQTGDVLYEGPMQIEQVVQDDGNDAGCYMDYNSGSVVPSEGTPLEFFKCGGTPSLDYVMYHWKLTGNKIAFNKITIKNGVFYWRDEIDGWEFSLPMEY